MKEKSERMRMTSGNIYEIYNITIGTFVTIFTISASFSLNIYVFILYGDNHQMLGTEKDHHHNNNLLRRDAKSQKEVKYKLFSLIFSFLFPPDVEWME